MFKNLLRDLADLSRTTKVSIPIAADERGFVDKECPADHCKYQFKVLQEDWRDLFRDEAVYCPMCGHSATSDQWWTSEQLEQARERTLEYVKSRINSALHRDAREFNRTHAGSGFVTMSMRVSGTERRAVILPISAAEVLEQRLACEACGARYAVIGAAFFCPCCSHNSVERMFRSSLQNVRARLEHLESIRAAVRDANGPDAAESLCRSVLEDALQHCVTAFQHYADSRYRALPGNPVPRMNVFQRLEDGDALWRAEVGAGYSNWLAAEERARLTVLFERRHLVAHRSGVVDEKYVAKSGDTTYRPGQRIVVTPREVRELAELVERLGESIRAATAGRSPAGGGDASSEGREP